MNKKLTSSFAFVVYLRSSKVAAFHEGSSLPRERQKGLCTRRTMRSRHFSKSFWDSFLWCLAKPTNEMMQGDEGQKDQLEVCTRALYYLATDQRSAGEYVWMARLLHQTLNVTRFCNPFRFQRYEQGSRISTLHIVRDISPRHRARGSGV